MSSIFYRGKTSFFRAINLIVSTKTLWSVLCLLLLWLSHEDRWVRDPSAASFGCLPGKGGFDKANKFSDNDARMLEGTQCRQEIKKCIYELKFLSMRASHKGPFLNYVRVFWAFFKPSTHLHKDISLHKVRENCHFLNHPPTPMSLRNIKMAPN